MRTLFADLRYAFRVMSRTPSFAVAVVSVLALGIGANTAIFSIVNAVLLRPLPFEEPERLVRIFTQDAGRSTLRALARQVLRLAAGCAVVRGHGDVSMLRLQGTRAHRHGHRASGNRDSCERGIFRDRQSPAGARTRLSARGGHARRQVRGRPERPVLEIRIRRQPGRDRPHHEAQRRSVHHRRSHAGQCLGRRHGPRWRATSGSRSH